MRTLRELLLLLKVGFAVSPHTAYTMYKTLRSLRKQGEVIYLDYLNVRW